MAAHSQQKGAPVDFPGQVLANPDHIAPTLDTDIPATKRKPLTFGARMSMKNAVGKPTGDISNGRQLLPDIWEREQ